MNIPSGQGRIGVGQKAKPCDYIEKCQCFLIGMQVTTMKNLTISSRNIHAIFFLKIGIKIKSVLN